MPRIEAMHNSDSINFDFIVSPLILGWDHIAAL
jgi:hypothetical protein